MLINFPISMLLAVLGLLQADEAQTEGKVRLDHCRCRDRLTFRTDSTAAVSCPLEFETLGGFRDVFFFFHLQTREMFCEKFH